MKFLIALIILSQVVVVHAQTSDEAALFPELAGLESFKKDQDNLTSDEVISQENETEDSQITSEQQEENSQQNQEEPIADENKEEEDDDDDKEQHIYLTMDNVEGTLTPNRNASFCKGTFIVANALKKQIKNFEANFTVGIMTKNFKPNGAIEKGHGAASEFTFLGDSCEKILNPPQIEIVKCEVEGWSEKKCKEKVQFVPSFASPEESM